MSFKQTIKAAERKLKAAQAEHKKEVAAAIKAEAARLGEKYGFSKLEVVHHDEAGFWEWELFYTCAADSPAMKHAMVDDPGTGSVRFAFEKTPDLMALVEVVDTEDDPIVKGVLWRAPK